VEVLNQRLFKNQCTRLEERRQADRRRQVYDLDSWIEQVDVLDPPERPADEPAYAAESFGVARLLSAQAAGQASLVLLFADG